jgi:predicted ester cyclase
MSQQNVDLVCRYYEITSGDLAGIEDIVTPDFLDHHFPPTLPQGPEGVKAFFTDVLGAFTNRKIEIFDIFACEERVAVRFQLVADHTSEFAGYQPSGQQITCGAMSMFRVENGKLAEGWESADLFGLFQQLQALQPAAV